MKRLIFALSLLWPTVGAGTTGKLLLEVCDDTGKGEPKANPGHHKGCLWYLEALLDAENAFTDWGHKDSYVCMPDGVAYEEIRFVWLRYAKKYPQRLQASAASLALDAFKQAWPCEVEPAPDPKGGSEVR